MSTVNIIPMAGLGSRFADAGYMLPKALVPVSGIPMIVNVIRHMPKADKWVFILRKEHIEQYGVDEVIKKEIKDAIIVSVDKTTEGQASTCMLAMPHIDPNESIFIAACDNSFLYDKEKYKILENDPSIDLIAWTFTKDKLLEISPKSWGWIKLNPDGMTIDDMSVKVPVSDTPFNDHAIVATFFFKKAQDFIDAYNLMVKENHRVNNEFYVDSMPIFMKKLGKKSVIFDVDLYVGWGKPSDLYLYEYNEFLYSQGKLADENWKKYFSISYTQ
jgi:NDP-sugar pyrophosphorylase family protein